VSGAARTAAQRLRSDRRGRARSHDLLAHAAQQLGARHVRLALRVRACASAASACGMATRQRGLRAGGGAGDGAGALRFAILAARRPNSTTSAPRKWRAGGGGAQQAARSIGAPPPAANLLVRLRSPRLAAIATPPTMAPRWCRVRHACARGVSTQPGGPACAVMRWRQLRRQRTLYRIDGATAAAPRSTAAWDVLGARSRGSGSGGCDAAVSRARRNTAADLHTVLR
jgi:hypothetical protein